MKKRLLLCGALCSLAANAVFAELPNLSNKVVINQVKYAKSKKSHAISAQQAARKVQAQYGGKVLKVKSSGSSSNPNYRVKLLKDSGHIIYVSVDAKSGQIKR